MLVAAQLSLRRHLGVKRNSHITHSPFSPQSVSPVQEAFSAQLAASSSSSSSSSSVEELITRSSLVQYNSANCLAALRLLHRSTNPVAADALLQVCGKMDFSPKELAEASFGFARNPGLFPKKIPEFLVRQIKSQSRDWDLFSMRHLIMLTRSFALAGQRDPVLLGRVYEACLEKDLDYEACEVDDFALLLGGFARFRYSVPRLCDHVAQFLVKGGEGRAVLDRASLADLASLVDCFARLGRPHADLFSLVAQRIIKSEGAADDKLISSRDIGRLLKAFSVSRMSDDDDALVQALGRRLCALDPSKDFFPALLNCFASSSGAAPAGSEVCAWLERGVMEYDLAGKCRAGDYPILLASIRTFGFGPQVQQRVEQAILAFITLQSGNGGQFTDVDLHAMQNLSSSSSSELGAALHSEMAARKARAAAAAITGTGSKMLGG